MESYFARNFAAFSQNALTDSQITIYVPGMQTTDATLFALGLTLGSALTFGALMTLNATVRIRSKVSDANELMLKVQDRDSTAQSDCSLLLAAVMPMSGKRIVGRLPLFQAKLGIELRILRLQLRHLGPQVRHFASMASLKICLFQLQKITALLALLGKVIGCGKAELPPASPRRERASEDRNTASDNRKPQLN